LFDYYLKASLMSSISLTGSASAGFGFLGRIDRSGGLDHRVGHFLPLSIMAEALERLVLSAFKHFCIAQKLKGVADAMIEAGLASLYRYVPLLDRSLEAGVPDGLGDGS
jgi:hypothetical protein